MKCSICGKTLSSYNTTGKCWSHGMPADYDWKKEYAKLMVGAGINIDRHFVKTQIVYQGRGEK